MALSVEAIVDTGVGVLREYGLSDISMRRLAKELGVQPGALYYHVPSKQELLKRIAWRILEPFTSSTETTPLDLMIELRDVVLPLRDGGDLLLVAYAMDRNHLPPASALQAALEDRGMDSHEAADRTDLIMRFVLGWLATEQNAALVGAEGASSTPVDPAVRGKFQQDQFLRGIELLLAR